MIDHTGIRVADLEKSRRFYLEALAPLGYAIRHQFPGAAGFGVAEGHGRSLDPGGDFWVVQAEPYVPRVHLAFSATTRAAVDAFYAAAMAAGGRDNGAPGIRTIYHPAYYAAFVYDPDGYNIEAVFHQG